MARGIGAQRVTVVRQERRDRLDTEPASSVEHDIEGCVILPRSSRDEEKGWVIVEGRQVVAPYGSDIEPDDRVRIDGELWDVDGAPGEYVNRRGRGRATMFYLKRLGT